MRIVWLTDFDLRGSGYANLSVPLCSGLIGKGHEIKAIGLGYNMQEHDFPFQLLPSRTLGEATMSILNLQNAWGADAVVVALDIPLQEQIMNGPYLRERKLKYVGLFPIESDPLCFSWAAILMQMDKPLVISKFGQTEARRVGIPADYIQIGIDTEAWKPVTQEEKTKLRSSFGFDEDTFAILTVADNQERKNLVAAMDMFAEFAKDKENARYILVTREHNRVGWKLRDYAQEIGISEKLMIFERGMSHEQLWITYAVSDIFLLTSKAEGLGMPLLEAMAVGIPCIATNCTGMSELLADERGFLVNYKEGCTHRDPFGNGRRYWIDIHDGGYYLERLYAKDEHSVNVTPEIVERTIKNAQKYVQKRTWDVAVDQVEKSLLEVCGDK